MTHPEGKEGERVWLTVIDNMRLPAVTGCVEEWKLENFIPDPFPASPRADSHKLLDWIFGEIVKVYFGDALVPNE